MKNVTVESEGLKRKGYEAVTVDGKDYLLGQEVKVNESEYAKLAAADLENSSDVKVTVTVSDAGEDAPADAPADDNAEGSEEPTPEPDPAKGRGR